MCVEISLQLLRKEKDIVGERDIFVFCFFRECDFLKQIQIS